MRRLCRHHWFSEPFSGFSWTLPLPASLASFVIAGMRLRSEGGMNFEASGGFLKWLLGAASCTPLSQHQHMARRRPGASPLRQSPGHRVHQAGIERVTNDFVNDFLVAHVVPVVAASLRFFKGMT